jgi:hypothetical protein
MKSLAVYSAMFLAAFSVMAADKDDVTTAAKKLADADNYSWTTSTEGAQFGGGETKAKTQKDGLIWTEVAMRDNTVEAFAKGGKAAVKGDGGWESVDLTAAPQRGGGGAGGGNGGGGGAPNPARMAGMRLRTLKAPAAEVADLVTKTKEITKTGDAYSGAFTEEAVKAMLTMGGGRGRGGNATPPTVSDAKGSLKVWIKDGVITKYQVKVSGTVTRNGNDRDVDRTTTVEIKDIGSTKITVPDEAKSKMS